MEFDLDIILTAGFIGISGFVLILIYPEMLTKNVSALTRPLFCGVLILLMVTIGNSIVAGIWNFNYILDFLVLKKVGRWFFRVSASFSYILLLWGTAFLIASKIETIKNHRKTR